MQHLCSHPLLLQPFVPQPNRNGNKYNGDLEIKIYIYTYSNTGVCKVGKHFDFMYT